MKKCYRCSTEQDRSEFNKNKSTKDGHQDVCRRCQKEIKKEWIAKNPERIAFLTKQRYLKDPEKFNAWGKRWRDANPEKVKDLHLRKKYGIDLIQYQVMFVAQGGKCLICSTHRDDLKMDLAVDHCHKTGKVRGLLCVRCNRAIGLLEDNPELLDKAASHLRTHQ